MYLRQLDVDVICLQETHAPADSAQWMREWVAPAIWTPHTAILLASNRSELTSSTILADGRLLLASITCHGHSFTLLNMYAPTDRLRRRSFFASLDQIGIDFDSLDFWLGDWNDSLRAPSFHSDNHRSLWSLLSPNLTNFFDMGSLGSSTSYFTFQHSAGWSSCIDHIFANYRFEHLTYTTCLRFPSFTDHRALISSLSPPSFSPPLLRRVNSSLLPRQDLTDATAALTPVQPSVARWDAFKVLARSVAQDYASLAAKDRASTRSRLERKYAQAQNRLRLQPNDPQRKAAVLDARDCLQDSLDYDTERVVLRARVRWLEEGERPSQYFFARFLARYALSSLSVLRDAQGSEFESISARHQHLLDHFSSVYSLPSFSSDRCSAFFRPLSLPQLSSSDLASLFAPFTLDELSAVIRSLPLRKSPGPDGIPYEWYRQYFPFIGPSLLAVFNAVRLGNDVPPSWAQTFITLIPKPDRNHSKISNWRPISLANCDSKIYSKLWANRLAHILPRLLHTDQAGFTKGRQACDIAMAVRTVLGHSATHHLDGALVFLDQEKAYDRLSRQYLVAALRAFGFPNLIINALTATFAPTFAHILDDGSPLPAFRVHTGVRQGDPLAPLLFNLALEPLLATFRLQLRGIRLPWGVFKVGAYADDVFTGLDPTDPLVFLDILDRFQLISNSHINFDKSLLFYLHPHAPLPSWISSLSFPVHDRSAPLRVLGFHLQLLPTGVCSDWSSLVRKLSKIASNLSARRVSVFGRSLLVQSLLLSRLWYQGTMSSPSHQLLTHIHKLAWTATWAGSLAYKPSAQIGRRSRKTGGLGYIDPTTQLTALQTRWITTFITSTSDLPWKAALLHALNKLPRGLLSLASHMPNRHLLSLPVYWQPFLRAWNKLQPHWPDQPATWTVPHLLAFPLADAHSTHFPRGLPLSRLIDSDNTFPFPRRLPTDVLLSRYQDAAPGRIESTLEWLDSDLSSFPAQLLAELLSRPLPFPAPSSFFALLRSLVTANLTVTELSTAAARRFLDSQAGIPTALDWSQRAISRHGLPPKDIWTRLHSAARLPYHREIWYKILYNALPIGTRIFHSRPEALCCHACPHAPQTLHHFLYSCPIAQAVWSSFRSCLDLPSSVSFHHALYSWSNASSSALGRANGFRLQAGHALALYVIWTAHTRAVFQHVPATPAASSARFLHLFARHIRTLRASRFAFRI